VMLKGCVWFWLLLTLVSLMRYLGWSVAWSESLRYWMWGNCFAYSAETRLCGWLCGGGLFTFYIYFITIAIKINRWPFWVRV
jgi:hypothetical protein